MKAVGASIKFSMVVYKVTEIFDELMERYKNTGLLPTFDIQTTNEDPATSIGRSTKIYTDGVIDGLNYPNHRGIDYYHTFREDDALFREMGFKCFRTSISWSRIFPNGDEEEPNETGLKFYEELFSDYRAKGMEPVVTLSHFEMPLHLAKMGGFTNRKVVDCFVRFATTVMERYKDLVTYWLTFNEVDNQMNMHTPIFPYTNSGIIPNPDDTPHEVEQKVWQAIHNEFVAAAIAVKRGREINPDFQIGCMLSFVPIYPETCARTTSCSPRSRCASVTCSATCTCTASIRATCSSGGSVTASTSQWSRRPRRIKDGIVDYISLSYYMSVAVSSQGSTLDAMEHGLDGPGAQPVHQGHRLGLADRSGRPALLAVRDVRALEQAAVHRRERRGHVRDARRERLHRRRLAHRIPQEPHRRGQEGHRPGRRARHGLHGLGLHRRGELHHRRDEEALRPDLRGRRR